MENFKEFLEKYKFWLIGGLSGLLIAILMLTIGFFPTLLIVIFVGLGALIAGSKVARQYIKVFAKMFWNTVTGKKKV